MNEDQLSSVIRSGLKILGTVLTTLGLVDATQAGIIVDALLVISGAAATLWGSWLSWKTHKLPAPPKP